MFSLRWSGMKQFRQLKLYRCMSNFADCYLHLKWVSDDLHKFYRIRQPSHVFLDVGHMAFTEQ